MEKIKQHGKFIIAGVIIIVIAGAFVWGRFGYGVGQSKLPYSFTKVSQGDFVRQIKLTGTVKAATEIQLAFARSGKVATVAVKVGDKVKSGQVIAELGKADLSADYLAAVAGWQMAKAQVAQAQANLDAQKFKKQDLLNGAKNEDVAVSQTQVDSAQKGLTDAETALKNVQAQADAGLNALNAKTDNSLSAAYDSAYDVVYHLTDPMFINANSDDPQLAFETPLNSPAKISAEMARLNAIKALGKMDADRKSLAPNYSNYADVFFRVDADLSIVKDYLDNLNNALNYTSPSNNFNQAAISADKSVVNGGITASNGSISALDALKLAIDLQIKVNQNNIFAAQTAVDQAQNALALAQGQLTLKKSSATANQLAMQNEQIKQAEGALSAALAQQTAAAANIAKSKAQLDNATIVAPIDGIITSVNLDPGEAVNANAPVIGLQSAGKFQVETYLPELYVGEVKAGDSAAVSFDAFGGDRIFTAKVIMIDPAAQMNNNTLAYRALLEFVNQETDIKTGLTANIKIITADDQNVLSVPQSSIIQNADKNFVITSAGERKEVTVGKTSGDGQIEILSGLSAGDSVADFGTLGAVK